MPMEEATPRPDPAAEAELIYPRRAELIRSLGGLPASCDFGPPSPELVHTIVVRHQPNLARTRRPAEAKLAAADHLTPPDSSARP